MQKIKVDAVEECITAFYDRVARSFDLTPSDNLHYDCTKIEVSNDIADAVERFYGDRMTFAMLWICSGPKVNESLNDGEVLVHDGFFC